MDRTYTRNDGVLLAALLLSAACVPAPADDEDETQTAATTSGSGSTTEQATSSGSTGNDPTSSTTMDPDGSSSDDASSTSDDPTGGADSCSEATLFAGDPTYAMDEMPNPAGEPLDGIPIPHRHLVFADAHLVTHVGEEIWAADLGAATPAFVRRVGEVQDGLQAFAPGPCATARVADTRGLVALDDGGYAVADYLGNAILVVDDLLGAACEVRSIAGNAEASAGVAEPLHVGDQDGTGTDAMLSGPKSLVRGGDGALYFIDDGNNAIKRVTAQGEVTTIAELPSDQPVWSAMTSMGDDLYVVGTSSQEDTILRIGSDGAVEVVLQGFGDLFPPLDSSMIANLQGVTTDGVGLIVSAKGYVWYVADGVANPIAGVGIVPDFPPVGYDPFATHPAAEVVLRHPNSGATTGGAALYVTYHEGDLYWNSVTAGAAYYIERIACP
jgi:hypothetical protein